MGVILPGVERDLKKEKNSMVDFLVSPARCQPVPQFLYFHLIS